MSPLFKLLVILFIIIGSVYECRADDKEPCEFGCKPFINCMPCSMVRDEEGNLQTYNEPGWCWIRGKK